MKKAVVIVLAAGILSAAAYSLYASGLNSEIKAEGLMTAKTSEQDVNLDDHMTMFWHATMATVNTMRSSMIWRENMQN